jgi:uncharacterized repeat protein (TIGR02543 family)
MQQSSISSCAGIDTLLHRIIKFFGGEGIMKKVLLSAMSLMLSCMVLFSCSGDSSNAGNNAVIVYTVSFNSNGGSEVAALSVNNGETIIEPAAPTKAAYVFGGWYKEDTLATAWNFGSDTVSSDVTLYAKWTAVETYTVTFNSSGGSDVASVVVNSGEKITKPADPTNTGYEFVTWYKEDTLTTVWNFASDTVSANTTLYANWATVGSKTLAESKTMISVPTTGITATLLEGRSVTLTPFSIGKYEITYLLWYIVKERALSIGYKFKYAGMEGSDGTDGAAPTSASGKPVIRLSWRDCIVWCNAYSEMNNLTPCYKTAGGAVIKDSQDANGAVCDAAVLDLSATGYRLPTMAEWEYAARYKDGTSWTPVTWASGATADYNDAAATGTVAWYDSNSGFVAHEVGSKGANQLGIFDMSGNAYEWNSDGGFPNGTSVTDPTVGNIGSGRFITGGSYRYTSFNCTVLSRSSSAHDNHDSDYGFRLVIRP